MFGEGNFLRAFFGDIITDLNKNTNYNGSVICLQGMRNGLGDIINSQNGKYHIVRRGVANGEVVEQVQQVDIIEKCINPYLDYEQYLSIAKDEDLKVIISNTTEFGIFYDEKITLANARDNYSAKLCQLLYERFVYFGGSSESGLAIIPCELIANNGDVLKDCVIKYSQLFGFEKEFVNWLNNNIIFAVTLVDRIVSGYPQERLSVEGQFDFEDKLVDVCEPFLFFAVRADKKINKYIPLESSNFDIVVADDISFYAKRKVRLLNGSHTMSVMLGHMCGLSTVYDMVTDDIFNAYIAQAMKDEIIPAVGSADKMTAFSLSVMERFYNPFLNHKLLDICLNSFSKYKARVLPTIKDYVARFGTLPQLLVLSFAGLLKFYAEYIDDKVKDDTTVVEFVKANKDSDNYVKNILSNTQFWGEDLTKIKGLLAQTELCYQELLSNDTKKVLGKYVK